MGAAAVAIVFVLAGGFVYRMFEWSIRDQPGAAPPPVGALAKLPLEIGDWRGIDVPLDERVVTATDTDDHISRLYQSGDRRVGLYIAFGTRFRDLLPHRPEVCYPAAGWVLQESNVADLTSNDDRRLTVRIHQFQGGPVDASVVTVLSYHVLDGVVVADVDELRSRGGGVTHRVRYVAQVQIRASDGYDVDSATDSVRAFAAAAAAPIMAILSPSPSDAPASASESGKQNDG